MGRRFNSTLAVIATVVGSIALVRLADAVGKRELARVARELEAEAEAGACICCGKSSQARAVFAKAY